MQTTELGGSSTASSELSCSPWAPTKTGLVVVVEEKWRGAGVAAGSGCSRERDEESKVV